MIGLTDTRALVCGEPRTAAIVSALPVAGPLVTTSVDAGRHRRGNHHSSALGPSDSTPVSQAWARSTSSRPAATYVPVTLPAEWRKKA